jgi:hypothetical protein
MADGVFGGGPSLDGFEDDDADEAEIITLAPGENPPEESNDEDEGKVVLSKEEYEALRSGTDSTGLLAEGLKELKDALGGQQAQVANESQQQPGESDEEFEKRLEQDLFAEGKSGKAIREAIQRYGGGQVSQLMGMLSQQNKKLLQLDEETGPIFKRYRSEIEDVVKSLPPEQQGHPQVWEYAVTQVKNAHRDELEQESVEQMVEKRVAEKLKELGVEEGGQRPAASGPYAGGGGGGRGSANVGAKSKKRVYVTEADKRIAEEKGMPISQYMQRKGGR